MNNEASKRIQSREAAVKAWLKETIEVKGPKLPVIVERVYAALESIDEEAAINEFSPDIIELQDFVNANEVLALEYEWSYDGGRVRFIHADEVYAYKSCEYDGKPGKTDLLTIPGHDGLEMDPVLGDVLDESWAGFCLDPVMNALYAEFDVEYYDKSEEYNNLNREAGIDIDLATVNNAYHELFHLKMMTLIREAYTRAIAENPINISTGKPLHIFIKRHERWPMHVLSLNI